MPYTVNKLAQISGVSSRTLRFYDEVDLLKPAYYGDNNYRYYKEEQLLMLQQILFFRELGFPLEDIKRIVSSDDFDKIEALNTHKTFLLKNLEKTECLLQTIDKTISHIRGKLIMSDVELYEGFDPKKQQEYEDYLIKNGTLTQEEIAASWEKVRHWKKNHWLQHNQECTDINLGLVRALTNHSAAEDPQVHALIQRHFNWVNQFWTPTRDSYVGLGQMYLEHPDFRAFYDAVHPGLVEFLVKAMKVYANNHLI